MQRLFLNKVRKKFTYIFYITIIILFITFIYFSYLKLTSLTNILTPDFSTRIIDTETLIKKVKNVNKLVPLEVELSQSIELDNSLYDLDIFKKTKKLTFFANCSYSIDLSTLNPQDIIIDNTAKKITLNLYAPEIYSIDIDDNKTVYYKTELGFLRFGDITLTSKDYGKIRNDVYSLFENKMNDTNLQNKAITNAEISIKKLISELVGKNYTIKIILKNNS